MHGYRSLSTILNPSGKAIEGTALCEGCDLRTTKFYARRFAHETVIHRADTTLAVGAEFTVNEEVAVDAIDEWMELGSLPMHFEVHPWVRELLGPGRTLHFHATDTAPEAAAEWLIDLTGDAIVWRVRTRRPQSPCAAR